MKMKFTALSFVVLTSAAGISSALASDGTINFTGSIISEACVVDSSSQNMTVDLGQVASSAFNQSGDKASATAFSIKLTDCPEDIKAAVTKFDGTPDTVNANLLKIDASVNSTSDAKNVAIEIAERDGTQIPLHTASKAVSIEDGAVTLPYVARYVSTADEVTAGQANGTSQFTINYQ